MPMVDLEAVFERLSAFPILVFEQGDVVLSEGSTTGRLLFLIQGAVDVGEETHRLATTTPEPAELLAWLFGELFGEDVAGAKHLRGKLVAAFKDGRRPATSKDLRELARGAVELVTAREQVPKRGDVKANGLTVTRLPRSQNPLK